METKEEKFDREQVLLWFRKAELKNAVKALAEAIGIVESRRVEEKFPENK